MAHQPPEQWKQSISEIMGRVGITAGMILVLLLLSAFPLPFGSLSGIRPYFALMAVFFWAVYRPWALSPLMTFTTGLLLDFLSGVPAGLNAVTLVAVQWLIVRQRKFLMGQSFPVLWMGFTLTALASGVLQWLLVSLFNSSWMRFEAVATSVLLTALLYPLAVYPLNALNRRMAK